MKWPLLLNKHYYNKRNAVISCIVLHVTAGLQDLDLKGEDLSAEGTVRYGQTVTRAASWHSINDSDTIIECLPDSYTAFHAKGVNANGLGLEICNQDAKWNNKPAGWTEKTLRLSAITCLSWEDKYGIPQRLITREQAVRGVKGYVYHSIIDPTRRQDPGKDFPIQRLWDYVNELRSGAKPPVEDEVDEMPFLINANGAAVAMIDGKYWYGQPNLPAVEDKQADGMPMYTVTEAEFRGMTGSRTEVK